MCCPGEKETNSCKYCHKKRKFLEYFMSLKITLDNSSYLFLRSPKHSSVNTLHFHRNLILSQGMSHWHAVSVEASHTDWADYRNSKCSNITLVHLDVGDSFKLHSAFNSMMTTIPVYFQKFVCPVAHEFYQRKSADSIQNYQRILFWGRLWIPKVTTFYSYLLS